VTDPRVIDHGNGISSIRLDLPFPSPRFVFSYVIEGDDGLAIIDAGVDLPESWATFTTGLEALGHDPSDPTHIIGSHMHPDHIGMANRMVDTADAEFVMHQVAADIAHLYDDWTIYRATLADLAARSGATSEEVAAGTAAVARPEWAPASPPITRPVQDGDRIDLGGRSLTVFHTPGHDRTHICMIDSATDDVFSGDHILPRITPHIGYDPDVDALAVYLESLERFRELDPPLTYPAHVGTPLEHGGARAHQIGLHHERRMETILDTLADGPQQAWQIMEMIFRPNLGPLERWQAFSETMSHIVLLANRREVEIEDSDGEMFYRRIRRRRRIPT
jgi:glyoxylase-like metal-dependent hydrolase (beta-lactamase superfamily II)